MEKYSKELLKSYENAQTGENTSEVRTAGTVNYLLNWDLDGAPVMIKPKTMDIFFEAQELIDVAVEIATGKAHVVNVGVKIYNTACNIINRFCDPQEIYFYELCNYECMYSRDDREAYKRTKDYFDKEIDIVRMYQ